MTAEIVVTPARFRTDFPEFADPTAYSDATIGVWLGIAEFMLNKCRWPRRANASGLSMYDYGIELFTAHNLAIERQAQKSAARGAPPGISTGPISSEGAGGVSVSYDTSSALIPGDSQWNLTVYGTRFAQLLKLVGTGPIQVGIGRAPIGSGGAWPGPWGGYLIGESW